MAQCGAVAWLGPQQAAAPITLKEPAVLLVLLSLDVAEPGECLGVACWAQSTPGHSCRITQLCCAILLVTGPEEAGRWWEGAGMLIPWMASQAVLWDVFFSENAKAVLAKISQSSPIHEPSPNSG